MNSLVASKPDPFVLLVEDCVEDQELTKRSFDKTRLAAELVIVDDGEQALELVLGRQRIPRLVLLDTRLPGIDGAAVLERLRAHAATRDVPVIVLTHEPERFRGRGSPRVVLTPKPLRPASFVAALEELGADDLLWRIAG